MKTEKNKIKKEILLKVQDTSSLPVIPGVAMEIMSFVDSDSTSMGQIAKCISQDPSLTAQILKVSNSAFYGLRNNVGSLELALILLGIREIKNIIFMMTVFKIFPTNVELSLDKNDFFNHSILTAQTAKILSELLGLHFESSPFLVGLLHDMGKIFLDQYFHLEYMLVLEEIKNNKKYFYQAEKKILGVTHADIGAALVENWALPKDIVETIKYHHDINKSKNNPLLTSIIHIANVLTNARNIGLPSPTKGISLEKDQGWKLLLELKPELARLDIERVLFRIDEELQKSKEVIKIYSS